MSTKNIKTGWLNDNNGDKLAPKTLFSQVQNNDGKTLDTALKNVIFYNPGNNENIEVPEEGGTSIDVTAKTGQTIIVKEVDASGKPTKWEAADYQMRTHGYEFVEVQPSVEITPFYNEEFSVPMEQFPSEFDIVIGEKYKVIFDGVEYICKAFLASMGNISAPAFGNTLVAGGADTGEPFAIFKIVGGTYPGIIFLDMNTHTVSVFETKTQKIPTEFIPSAEELFIHTKEILPEVEAIPQDGYFVIPSPIFFIQNAEYIINYNGVEYEFIPEESSFLDYPFFFYPQENGIVLIHPRDDVTSITISIKEKIVEKIPEDCLPDIKTSDLTNDSGFITSNDVPVKSVNGKTGAVTIDVPTKTSDLTNDSGFITGITVDSTLSSTSTNPVQNKVINSALAEKADKQHEHDYISISQKGNANGVAELDSNGKVPTSQLPSYVDDVIEASSKSAFPTTGESGKIYVDLATNKTYRWSGSAYTEISASLAIGTTASTAAAGNHGHDNATTSKSGFMSTTDKSKLDGIEAGANKITVDSSLSSTSTNPVQNKVVDSALSDKVDKTTTINGHALSENVTITKSDVNLSNVVNTGDSATPVSGGTTKFTTGGAYTELNKKVDKISGKGLSTNDYTTNEKNKLAGIDTGANKTIVDSSLSDYSANPVQNNVVNSALNNKMDKSNPTGSGSFSMNRLYGSTIGNYSFAEGFCTTASGQGSHSEGLYTTASGKQGSHAEGNRTIASGYSSHAEGSNTTAKGQNSHAEGSNTMASGNSSHVEGYAANHGFTISGDANATIYSTTDTFIKVGYEVNYNGITSTITAIDKENGTFTVDKTLSDIAIDNVEASYLIDRASGQGSHAEGYDTIASGQGSHAEGSNTTASEYYSHSEGDNTTASGYSSHSEGQNTTASGQNSHAEGSDTTTSGYASHSEGDNTIASGDHGSHAEGYNTTASGDYGSHAEGYQTIANGDASHAEGQGTIASGPLSHVQGNYNIEDTSGKYAHIVGNGHSNNNRSNAHTLDWNGNAWFKGNLKIGGTSQDDTNAKVIATIDNIPTKTSDLTNDSGFITSNDVPVKSVNGKTGTVTIDVPTKTSDLTNDSGFITNVDSSLNSSSTNPVQNKVVNSVLSNKVDKISGKGLSTNDYTTNEKNKLAGIDTGANKTVVDSSLSSSSTNPVQNKVIQAAIDNKMNTSNPTGTGSFSMNRLYGSTIGGCSFAEGYYITASGYASHAEGNNTIASGESSHAEGLCSSNPFTISGDANATIYNTTDTSIKVGQVVIYNNITSTITAIDKENGTFTVDKTLSDTAIDNVNATYKVGGASGKISHTEGYNTTASGYTSHAEGNRTIANGQASHAEGSNTTAKGYYSHAEGSDTIASGSYSHAEGRDTIASGSYSHVQGRYNIEDTKQNYAHIVGNGTNNSTRSNAHTLDWNGNAWFKGELKIGGTSQDDTNAKKIATEAYVNEQISAALDSIESALGSIESALAAI